MALRQVLPDTGRDPRMIGVPQSLSASETFMPSIRVQAVSSLDHQEGTCAGDKDEAAVIQGRKTGLASGLAFSHLVIHGFHASLADALHESVCWKSHRVIPVVKKQIRPCIRDPKHEFHAGTSCGISTISCIFGMILAVCLLNILQFSTAVRL